MRSANISISDGQPRRNVTDMSTTNTPLRLLNITACTHHARMLLSASPTANNTWRRPTAGLMSGRRATDERRQTQRQAASTVHPLRSLLSVALLCRLSQPRTRHSATLLTSLLSPTSPTTRTGLGPQCWDPLIFKMTTVETLRQPQKGLYSRTLLATLQLSHHRSRML